MVAAGVKFTFKGRLLPEGMLIGRSFLLAIENAPPVMLILEIIIGTELLFETRMLPPTS